MEIYDFDAVALYRALDEKRAAHQLTWTGVAREIWELSFGAQRRTRRSSDQPLDNLQHGATRQHLLPARSVHAPLARAHARELSCRRATRD